MRIIIAGGSGLIGTPLTTNLTCDGHEVVVLTRKPERLAASLPDGATAQKWDAKTAVGWGHLVDTSDAIINLANILYETNFRASGRNLEQLGLSNLSPDEILNL